jgi:DNA-binding response OmpR family regulator
MKILLVDDDEALLGLLSLVVQRAGFQPITASDGSSALRLLNQHQPDLLVLDIKLGREDGLEVLESVRRFSGVPIVMLSSLHSEDDIERGLQLGADDYLTKPFSFRELVARIRAVLRRTDEIRDGEPLDPWIRVGPLGLNMSEHIATLHGCPLELTRTEFRMLKVLMENAGRIVEHRVVLKEVWGCEDADATAQVRAALFRLRRKLATEDERSMIRTVPGVGVVLEPARDGLALAAA